MESYRDLLVWQKSIELVTLLYRLTDKFPKTETFGLTNQIRRAAVSVPANIAEGYRRGHRLEYIQFLRIAFGSGAELETHLTVACNLGFVTKKDTEKADRCLEETMRMLNKMLSSLSKKT